MELFVISIVTALSSFWVFYDARSNKLGSAESDTPSPFKMALGCLFIWIICFPYYLVKRKTFIEKAALNPSSDVVTTGQKVVLLIAVIVVFGIPYKSFSAGAIPTCDSQEAIDLINEVVTDNYGAGYSLSDYAQVSYDKSAEVRRCRMTWTVGENRGISDFMIEWYSDKKEMFTVSIQ